MYYYQIKKRYLSYNVWCFKLLKSLKSNLTTETTMIGYEQASINAIKTEFPNTENG